jgi:hypothetical protein
MMCHQFNLFSLRYELFVTQVDDQGRMINGAEEVIAISGYLRSKGRSEWEVEKLLKAKGIYPVPEEN